VEVKIAVTLRAWVTVRVHVPVPVQCPPQPAKVESGVAVAVRVTEVPESKRALQVGGQTMPAGLDVTVPLPDPPWSTAIEGNWPVKVAVTLRAWIMVTLQDPVPEHPSPLHPVKADPAAGTAVRGTRAPNA